MMQTQELKFDTQSRYWSTEREAVNFFARHDGVELEFIVTKEALLAVGHFPAPIGEETALAIFDSYEPLFLDAATRVWFAMEDSKPVYFIHDSDLAPDQ